MMYQTDLQFGPPLGENSTAGGPQEVIYNKGK